MSSPGQPFTGRAHADAVLAADVSDDLRFLLDVLPDGVIFLDREWRITYANTRARSISHLRPEHLNGPTHWELYPTTVGTEQERKYRRAMEERTEEQLTFFYSPFGIWIELRALPIDSGIAVYFRDVTEAKLAQQAAAETARQLQQVFNATNDGVLAFNREWQYTFLNRRAQELLSSKGDLLGKVLWHEFPESVYTDSPVVANYYRAMVDRVPTRFETYSPAPLDRWFNVEAQPSPDGIVVFLSDITERKHAEQVMQAQQVETERQRAELEAIYRSAPVGLALIEPEELRYLRVSDRQAEFIGMSPEQLVGKRVEDVVTSPVISNNLRKIVTGEEINDGAFEVDFVARPDGGNSYRINYSPVLDGDGRLRAISVAAMDITQLRKAEKALVQSEKLAAVGRLASSISHEINNPLEAITNLLYLTAAEDGLSERARLYVRSAQEELARVSQIATQSLRFHRQANKPTEVTPAQLVDSVLQLYQGRLANSGVHVEASYSTAVRMLCFENDIRQVLANLIGNAIDAMRTGGRLLIRAHAMQHAGSRVRGVRILVGDTGTGMSAETQRRLFEPFYTTKGMNGTGLGLWITKQIVERHCGQLRLRTQQGGAMHGTVFSLFLPLRPPDLHAS